LQIWVGADRDGLGRLPMAEEADITASGVFKEVRRIFRVYCL